MGDEEKRKGTEGKGKVGTEGRRKEETEGTLPDFYLD